MPLAGQDVRGLTGQHEPVAPSQTQRVLLSPASSEETQKGMMLLQERLGEEERL